MSGRVFGVGSKIALFVLCLGPVFWTLWQGLQGGLGANPIEAITHRTGDWTLRLLLITLAITPLRMLTRQTALLRYRRMLGLFAFFYACLHLMTYLWLDQFFVWDDIVRDIAKRPFITVGFLGFVLLVPLAVTSTKGMMRRLGRNWARLHRLVYLVGIAGVLHYWWLVKADVREPLIYALVLVVLLALRVPGWMRRAAVRRDMPINTTPARARLRS